MITVNYEAINKILDDLMKNKTIKNKSQLFQRLAIEMNISLQQCWRLIEKQTINNITQINKLALALGVDVMEIITIEPKDEQHIPIAQIY